MLYLKGLYNPTLKLMLVEYKSSHLKKHFQLMEESVKYKKSLGLIPNDLEIKSLDDTKCVISFHIDIPENDRVNTGDKMSKLSKSMTDKLCMIIDDFIERAINAELETSEFIPLSGISVETLKSDVVDAVKDKRDLVIVDTYNNCMKFILEKVTTIINQYRIPYMSEEYSDVVLYVYEGNMKKLRELYKDKLMTVDWSD